MLGRDEFVSFVVGRAKDATRIGEVMAFVSGVLMLQNDSSRPVYVLEVPDDVTPEEVSMLDVEMNAIGVACVLVPRGLVSYVGEVTSESFGQENAWKGRIDG